MQPNPLHIEYNRGLRCVTERRDLKIAQQKKLCHYKQQTLRRQTIANRSQLHSQYFQEAREIRESLIYDLGKQLYDIQKEMRLAQADALDKYTYKFRSRKRQKFKQQEQYNAEVSILAGMAKHVGFPAAPELPAARHKEQEADLAAMKVCELRCPGDGYTTSTNVSGGN